MNFLWPGLLWLLAAVPLLVAVYFRALSRRRKMAVRYAGLDLVREAARGQRWRRHIPALLFLLAIITLLLAVARPSTVLTLPSKHETVVLTMDVSGSMRASDVEPTRLGAAQVAARSFVRQRPHSTRVGIVTFGGSAALVQAPTQSREELLAAIDRFELQRGTAVGSGILMSLKTIFPEEEFRLASRDSRRAARSASLDDLHQPMAEATPPVAPGSYTSAVIILLSDGQTTTGPDPIAAARLAAERGVRIYTVGIGTPHGEILIGDGWSMRVRLDEQALEGIARATGGEYFYAGTAHELKSVYDLLTSRLVFETRETEITSLFAAAGALLAVLSALLSIVWFNRIL